jgi:hypothetical protein
MLKPLLPDLDCHHDSAMAQNCALLLILLLLAPAAQAREFHLRVGPTGEFPSLSSAIEHLVAQKRGPVDARINVDPGVYSGESIVLRPPDTLRSLSIAGEKAVFDGIANQATFLRLIGIVGRPTRISISGITIRRYKTAILLYGSREERARWNSDNVIRGIAFEDIGARAADSPSTAVIGLFNSRRNTIEGNTFVRVYNTTGCGAMHALYLAHFSSENSIKRNWVEQPCGDPVRLRDASDNNVAENNGFANAAHHAYFTEWFCDRRRQANCTKLSGECPPLGNVFRQDGMTARSGDPPGPVYANLSAPSTGCSPDHP